MFADILFAPASAWVWGIFCGLLIFGVLRGLFAGFTGWLEQRDADEARDARLRHLADLEQLQRDLAAERDYAKQRRCEIAKLNRR